MSIHTPIADKTVVVFSACHDDEYLVSHFLNHYQTLGIKKFACLLRYYTNDPEDTEIHKFNLFCNKFKESYPFVLCDEKVIFNKEETRTKDWFNLIKNLDVKYAIPADSDEFHEYATDKNYTTKQFQKLEVSEVNKNFEEFAEYVELNNLDYITSCHMEHVSATGTPVTTEQDTDIFKQFSYQNKNLFRQPKISLIKMEHFNLLQLGHHGLAKDKVEQLSLKSAYLSITHHFRWSKEGETRMQKWLSRWSDPSWKGWKNLDIITRRLLCFKQDLRTYDPNSNG